MLLVVRCLRSAVYLVTCQLCTALQVGGQCGRDLDYKGTYIARWKMMQSDQRLVFGQCHERRKRKCQHRLSKWLRKGQTKCGVTEALQLFIVADQGEPQSRLNAKLRCHASSLFRKHTRTHCATLFEGIEACEWWTMYQPLKKDAHTNSAGVKLRETRVQILWRMAERRENKEENLTLKPLL